MSCDTCFPDYLAKCNDFIRVYAQLPALAAYQNYRWVITDKFQNQYEGNFIVDENGFWEIDVDDLPDGLLTEYSGSFKMQVYDQSCAPVKFKIAKDYDCISFEVKGGTFVKDNLGCEFTCVSAPAGQSALVTFTDESEVSITWAPYLSFYGNNPTIQVYHLISPGVYQLVDVQVQQVYTGDVLTSIEIDNGGVNSGYVIIS